MPPDTLVTVVAFNGLLLLALLSFALVFFQPKLWHGLLALFLGALTGLTDLRSDVQLPALMLLAFGAFFGFARPRRAWLFALLLGLWVPLVALVARALGVASREAGAVTNQQVATSFLALGIAFAGAYGGAALRWLRTRTLGETDL
jgi:hypothetical protein